MKEQERRLTRKYIKSFASGLAHQFAHSAEHYAWLAYIWGVREVRIDLLELRIEPARFDIFRNRNLVERSRITLLQNVAQLVPPAAVVKAELVACFGVGELKEGWPFCEIGASTFTVTLTDELGK